MQIMQTSAAAFLMLAAAAPAFADDVWHATRTLMPGDTLRAEDVVAHAPVRPVPDAVPASQAVIGLEVKRRLSDGRVLSRTRRGTALRCEIQHAGQRCLEGWRAVASSWPGAHWRPARSATKSASSTR